MGIKVSESQPSTGKSVQPEEEIAELKFLKKENKSLLKKSKDLEDEVHEKTQEIDNLKETLDRRNISSQSTASSLADELDKDQPKCNSFYNKSQCREEYSTYRKCYNKSFRNETW